MLKNRKGLIVVLILAALFLIGALSSLFSKGECRHVFDEKTNICRKCGEDGPDPDAPNYDNDVNWDDNWTDFY